MNVIDEAIVEATRAKADSSPRKRAPYNLHNQDDHLQRMLQVANHGTYATPHMHSEKLELFVILEGQLAVNTFNDDGSLKDVAIIGRGPVLAEIAPGTWHNIVVIGDSASFIEIIEGYYDPKTHKEFAPWAPREEDPDAPKYLERLTRQIADFTKDHPGKS